MVCPICGADTRPGQKFCAECGSRLANACANCGTPYEGAPKFCAECGAPLSSPDPGTAATTTPPTDTEVRTGTELRLVSVLFCDLVDFTVLSESREPEAVRELLSRYFDLARDVVDRYGGSIEKFIGDAVMAVWGTPVAHEDDAERAVRAALELVDSVRSLGSASDGRTVQLRAAVLTGEAAVTIGATGQGMVAGDLVNTASRLQSVAPPGSVLVGESTYRAASRAISFEPVGEQTLKGKALAVPAWRALRVVAERGGRGRAERLEAPFVGREAELRLLKELLHATGRERRARLVSIVGQAGIGKSRLAWEFLKYVDGLVERIWWHQGRSPAYGEGVAFWALGEMVRRRARIAETDDERKAREQIAETLTEFVPDETERRWIEQALLTLLGIDDAPGGAREELFAAWRTFFERIAATGTVVMVFEDVHWADPGLLDFIDHVLDWSRNHPILIVTLARPELLDRRPDWGAARRNFVSLSLEPLSEDEMRSLLAGLVPGLPESAVRTIHGRAEGVPLYAIETVRMLLDEGRLEAVEGAYRPVGDLSRLEVPDTLHALVAARLDALDPAERALVQDAAVLGQSFTPAGLAAVAGMPADELEPRLRALVRRELLASDADPRSPERGQYRFVQAVIREVAYGTLSRRDRLTRHLAAARFFEGLGDDELAGALATHYLEAYRAAPEGAQGEAIAAQARLALNAAAERSRTLGSHAQAVTYLEQAMTLTSDPSDETELLRRAGAAATSAGQYELAQSYLRRAVDRYRELGDRSGAARGSAELGRTLLDMSRPDDALAILEPALAELADVATDPAVVELTAAVAHARMRAGDHRGAVEWADRALEGAEQLDLIPVIVDALTTRASSVGALGRLREAFIVLEGVVRLARERHLVRSELRARLNLGWSLMLDDPRAALATSWDGLELARRLGERGLIAYFLGNAAEMSLPCGEWDLALAQLADPIVAELDPVDRVVAEVAASLLLTSRGEPVSAHLRDRDPIATGLSEPQLVAAIEHAKAWAALAAGRIEDVRTHAEAATRDPAVVGRAMYLAARASFWLRDVRGGRAALERLEQAPFRGRVVEAQRRAVRAGVHALEGKPESSHAYLDAFRAWRELDLPFELALAQLDFVTLLQRDDGEAARAAHEARSIFERLGAKPFLERLESVVRSGRTSEAATSGARSDVPERTTAPR